MARIYLENEATGRQYDVVRIDKDANELVLKGPLSGEFREKYDKDRLQRLGYTLKRDD